MPPQFPLSIYSSDQIILEQDYIFIYCKSDGFSSRGLHADLIINSTYEYNLQLKSNEFQESTNKKFSLFISGDIPLSIKEKLDYLTSLKHLKKKINAYYGFTMDDIGSQHIVIKNNNEVIHTSIGIIDFDELTTNKAPVASKELIEMHDLINDWIMKIYNSYQNI